MLDAIMDFFPDIITDGIKTIASSAGDLINGIWGEKIVNIETNGELAKDIGAIADFGALVEKVILGFAKAVALKYMPELSILVPILLLIYMTIQGWLIMSGRSKNTIPDLVWELGKISLLCFVALNIDHYTKWAIDGVASVEAWLMKAFVVNNGMAGSGATTLWKTLQINWNVFCATQGEIWELFAQHPISDVGGKISILLIVVAGWLGGGWFFFNVLSILALSKIAVTLILAMGPVFLVLGMWPATRDFLNNWVKTLCCYVLMLTLIMGVGSMFVMLLTESTRGYATIASLQGVPGKMPSLAESAAMMVVISGILSFVIRQIPAIAQGLTGKFIGANASATTAAVAAAMAAPFFGSSDASKKNGNDNEKKDKSNSAKAGELVTEGSALGANAANNTLKSAGLKLAAGLLGGLAGGAVASKVASALNKGNTSGLGVIPSYNQFNSGGKNSITFGNLDELNANSSGPEVDPNAGGSSSALGTVAAAAGSAAAGSATAASTITSAASMMLAPGALNNITAGLFKPDLANTLTASAGVSSLGGMTYSCTSTGYQPIDGITLGTNTASATFSSADTSGGTSSVSSVGSVTSQSSQTAQAANNMSSLQGAAALAGLSSLVTGTSASAISSIGGTSSGGAGSAQTLPNDHIAAVGTATGSAGTSNSDATAIHANSAGLPLEGSAVAATAGLSTITSSGGTASSPSPTLSQSGGVMSRFDNSLTAAGSSFSGGIGPITNVNATPMAGASTPIIRGNEAIATMSAEIANSTRNPFAAEPVDTGGIHAEAFFGAGGSFGGLSEPLESGGTLSLNAVSGEMTITAGSSSGVLYDGIAADGSSFSLNH